MEVMPREKSFDPPRVRREAFSYYPRLQRLERYVESHYAEPLPLRTAAQVAGLEQTYFSRFFRQKTMPPACWPTPTEPTSSKLSRS